jgi:hypothetical protein
LEQDHQKASRQTPSEAAMNLLPAIVVVVGVMLWLLTLLPKK